MRILSTITTHEMTDEEWKEFRRQWIADYASGLVLEVGTPISEAHVVAEIRFEDYCGQEGYTARNERILAQRESNLPGIKGSGTKG